MIMITVVVITIIIIIIIIIIISSSSSIIMIFINIITIFLALGLRGIAARPVARLLQAEHQQGHVRVPAGGL